MQDYELKLKQDPIVTGGAWQRVTANSWNGVICDSSLRHYVSLPKHQHTITLVFSEKRKQNSFKLAARFGPDSRCNPFMVCGTKRVALYHGADLIIRRQLRRGRKYVRVEY